MGIVSLMFCKIAVKYPKKDSVLTYLQSSDPTLEVGSLVEVPLGRRSSTGIVVEKDLGEADVDKEILNLKLKPNGPVIDADFKLSTPELELYKWMAKYYHYSLGQLIFDCLPKILKRPRAIEFQKGKGEAFPFEPTSEQQEIFESINSGRANGFERSYLHGVTGSGKTLIYLNLIKSVLEEGKSVLFLLPEINLTPQFTETFLKHLDCKVLSYHSGVTNSEKNLIWKELKTSDKPVLVMGVRSSVFLPIQKLGLVVVDEEHDHSFKQNDRCPYNGRDVAIKKAQLADACLVLGSATPVVENYYNYKFKGNDTTHYYELKNRVGGSFPKVELLDARGNGEWPEYWPFRPESLEEIRAALNRNEQALVFINRLGFANYVQCSGCGYKFTDPNTEVNLRYFKNRNVLSSAHSDYEIPMPEECPECGNMNLKQKGFGTERIQEVLTKVFPDNSIGRFDRDEIKNTDQLVQKLDDFHTGKIDVLVGTQMLSKGHNFAKVNLVLILGIDSQLNFPDFRAVEKTYQLLTQVTGRAGRYSDEAKVVVQTMAPENDVFKYVVEHSFNGFYEKELSIRENTELPPFCKMAMVHFSHRFRDKVVTEVQKAVNGVNQYIDNKKLEVDVLGPVPLSIERKAGQFSWCFMIKSGDLNQLHHAINYFESAYKPISGLSCKVDVDPYSSL